ncbi:hypothetical protein [Martelella soudanensis]|uniref:hypothetical protein n=1 Tax=unclassified Martelella TaxID=2629616 RepID=UPI001AEE5DCB|nr:MULTISPECIES: hypothetical protein [unclassified Martelella]
MPLNPTLWRFRFTLAFLAIMLVANAFAGTFSGQLPETALAAWGIGKDAVWSGDVWRFVTATFLSHDRGMLVRQFFFAAAILGYTEWKRGSASTFLLFFSLDLAASCLLLLGVALWPDTAGLSAANDVGMSLGGFGLIGLAASGTRWRFPLLAAVLLMIGIKIGAAFDPLADLGHVIALWMGFLLGLVQVRMSAR